MKNLGVDHGEHDRATTDLTTVSGSVKGRTKGKLKLAKGHHNRTRGKDSIARVIDPVADRAVKLLTKAADDMGDHLGGGLSQGVKNNSKGQKNTDHDARDRLSKIRAGHDGDSGGHSRPSGDGKNSPSVQPDSARDVRQEPRNHAIPEHSRTCKTDPVDVASGEMVLAQTDLSLPGVLPLVLRRAHLSGYHYGQFFGRSWASTLDERLELDGAGAIWVREDGSLLVYPRLPRSGEESVLPVEGPQLPLSYGGQNAMAETSYRVTDPHTGLTLTFTGSPYRPTPLYWLASRQDRNGNGIEIVRQETGIPTAVVHDGGYHATLTTDPGNGRVTALSLRTAEGPIAVLTYGYDAAGNLTEVTNSSGLPCASPTTMPPASSPGRTGTTPPTGTSTTPRAASPRPSAPRTTSPPASPTPPTRRQPSASPATPTPPAPPRPSATTSCARSSPKRIPRATPRGRSGTATTTCSPAPTHSVTPPASPGTKPATSPRFTSPTAPSPPPSTTPSTSPSRSQARTEPSGARSTTSTATAPPSPHPTAPSPASPATPGAASPP